MFSRIRFSAVWFGKQNFNCLVRFGSGRMVKHCFGRSLLSATYGSTQMTLAYLFLGQEITPKTGSLKTYIFKGSPLTAAVKGNPLKTNAFSDLGYPTNHIVPPLLLSSCICSVQKEKKMQFIAAVLLRLDV